MFLKHEQIVNRIDFNKDRVLDALWKQSKANEADVRVGAINLLESLILSMSLEKTTETQFYDIAFKIFRNTVSTSEKSLNVRATILRCIQTLIPKILTSSTYVIQLQTLLLKEISTSPAVGHVYGILLASLMQKAPKQQISTRVSLEGYPSHLKEVESFYTVLDHIRSIFVKYNRNSHRESVARCAISFLKNTEMEYIEVNINRLLFHFGEILTNPNLKVNKNVLIPESKSALSAIFREGVIYQLCDQKKLKLLAKMFSYIESLVDEAKQVEDTKAFENFSISLSFILGEAYYLMGLLGELILSLTVDCESIALSIISICKRFTSDRKSVV